jgi:hypothetical protein
MLPVRLFIAFCALTLTAVKRYDPPDACTLVTLDDVRAALDAGWTASPPSLNAHLPLLSSCSYQNGMGNLVAFSIQSPQGGNAKDAVSKLQASVSVKHVVVALPDLCDGGFSEVNTKKITTVYAAKGKWQLEIEVLRGDKPDVDAGKALVAGACKRL